MSTRHQGRHHRLRQHRHRSDDQGQPIPAPRDGGDGRHRPRLRRPRPGALAGRPRHPRGCRGTHRPARLRRHRAGLRRHLGQGPRGQRRPSRAVRQDHDRPDAGGDRPLRHPRGQPRPAPRRTQRQHGHLRRSGHDPGRRRDQPRRPSRLRRDRRLDRVALGRPRYPREHRRVHRDDLRGHRGGRRRRPRQGDHRPQPGRAAADHARHRACARDLRRRPDLEGRIRASVEAMVADVAAYVPGYRLKQEVQVTEVPDDQPVETLLDDPVESAPHPPGLGVPRSRGRRRLPPGLRRQPRHHDLGRHPGRRATSQPGRWSLR